MDNFNACEAAYNNGYKKGREDAIEEFLTEFHKPFMALINKYNEYADLISNDKKTE